MSEKFYWMHKDDICTEISVDCAKGTVEIKNFKEDPLLCAFGVRERVGLVDLRILLESRHLPNRGGIERLTYRGCGLSGYPTQREIIGVAHGMIADDFFWLKGEDELVSFDELRRGIGLKVDKPLPLKKLYKVEFTDKDKYGVMSLITRASQDKWVYKGWFIKQDTVGMEAMAEVFVNCFLNCCEGLRCLEYVLLPAYNDELGICASLLYPDVHDVEFVPVWTVIEKFGLEGAINRLSFFSSEQILKHLEETLSECMNFDVKAYLHTMLYIDSIILNIDRHFNNMAFVRTSEGKYECMPYYDHGLTLQPHIYMSGASPRIFGCDFEELVTLLDDSYRLRVDVKKLCTVLTELGNKYDGQTGYYANCFNRVRSVLLSRLQQTKGKAWRATREEDNTLLDELCSTINFDIPTGDTDYHIEENDDIAYGNTSRK